MKVWTNECEMPATLAELAENVMRRVEAGEVTKPEPFYDLALHATLALKRAERAREAFPPRPEAAERLAAYAKACVLLLQQVDEVSATPPGIAAGVKLGSGSFRGIGTWLPDVTDHGPDHVPFFGVDRTVETRFDRPFEPEPPRSLWSRARDALAGLVAGWRGES